MTGSGTEFGNDISNAMAFTKISDSEFVIFSKLTAGLPFKYINNIADSNIRSFSISNNKLVEDSNGTKIAKSGI